MKNKLENIQSELAYTTDDTYLFNYKNKEKDLDKLLYKLSRYEKLRKKIKKDKKKHKKQKKEQQKQKNMKKETIHEETIPEETIHKETIHEKEKNIQEEMSQDNEVLQEEMVEHNNDKIKKSNKSNKNTINKENKKIKLKEEKKAKKKNIVGGNIDNIPTLLFVPLAGGIMVEPNYIKLHNNTNLYRDLVLFIINNIINVAELSSMIYIYNSYINNIPISFETIIVILTIYITRIIVSICVYKKTLNFNKSNKNDDSNNIEKSNKNKDSNKVILLSLFCLPLIILLINMSKYELIDNVILTCIITILVLPYIRLLYINFTNKSTHLLNITEKIIIALLILIIIQNNFDINNVIYNIRYLNNVNISNNINLNNKDENVSNNVLLNNFNNLFNK